MLHEHEQQLQIELSRQCHDGNLKEKIRFSRMLNDKNIFQERVLMNCRSILESQRQRRNNPNARQNWMSFLKKQKLRERSARRKRTPQMRRSSVEEVIRRGF